MSKARAEKSHPQGEPPAEARARAGAKGQAKGPLAEAQAKLSRGDVRGARALLRGAVESGSDAEKAEAQALLARIAVDPGALLAIACVAAVILFATLTAILLRR